MLCGMSIFQWFWWRSTAPTDPNVTMKSHLIFWSGLWFLIWIISEYTLISIVAWFFFHILDTSNAKCEVWQQSSIYWHLICADSLSTTSSEISQDAAFINNLLQHMQSGARWHSRLFLQRMWLRWSFSSRSFIKSEENACCDLCSP